MVLKELMLTCKKEKRQKRKKNKNLDRHLTAHKKVAQTVSDSEAE